MLHASKQGLHYSTNLRKEKIYANNFAKDGIAPKPHIKASQ